MDAEKQYRDSVLTKIKDILEMANENVLKQEPSEHTRAMSLFVQNMAKMAETLKDVKDSNSFVAVANGLDQVLENEFFSKIHGPRIPVKKDFNPFEEVKKSQPSASAEKESTFNIKTHVVGIDDVNELPVEVRLKLAQALKAMGVPEQEINSQLNLGGF